MSIFFAGVPANISDERIEALTQLKETLNKNDPAVLFNVVNELSVVSILLGSFLKKQSSWHVSFYSLGHFRRRRYEF